MEDLKNLFDNVIANIVSNVIVTLLSTVAIIFVTIYNHQQNVLLILVIYAVYLFLMLIFGHKYKVKRISSGREVMMKANTSLITKSNIRKIYSTRVTYWLLDESSPNRVSFRNALTEQIHRGVEVRRLWHIRSNDDVKRLIFYLNKYKDYDNLSVRCFIGDNIILPELLVSYPLAASISLPQQNSPRKICVAYHFKNKQDISYWMEYFNVLWEVATPILVCGNLQRENLETVKNAFRGGARN